jgi:hypothetical protein
MSGPIPPMVSVLVVVSERPVALDRLYTEHAAALRRDGWTFEFIFVLETFRSRQLEQVLDLRSRGEPIRVVEVAQSMGEATLLRLAAARARGQLFLSLPAYWRVEPASVPELLRAVDGGADMAVARRWPRADSWINRLQNRVFHGLLRSLIRSPLNDLACGVRAFRPSVLEEVPLYGDFHRFFPLLADRAGFRVEELRLPQHPDDVSPRIYSPGTYLRRVLDLLGMFFLLRFANKPLRFFGLLGSTLAVAGGVILLVLAVQRIGGQGIADRPMLLLGVLFLALGVQAVALGLIGEIIVFLSSHEHPPYRLASEPSGSVESAAREAGGAEPQSIEAARSG